MPDFDNLPQSEQDKYHDKAAELLSGLLWCTRVWEAWYVGTMKEHDFINADEDDDIVYDTAKALYEFVKQEQQK